MPRHSFVSKIFKKYQSSFFKGEGGGEGGEWRKGSSFCGTPAKRLQNLRPAATKVIILRLRHHQDS